MRVRIAVIVMAGLLALYLLFAVRYGLILIGAGEPLAVAIGVALLILPLVGAWAMVSEILFAVRAERLARRLEAEGGLPSEEVPVSPSGRVDRAAADALFPQYQAAVDADPENWRAWYRLALAYDASGDRRRARWATRTAIRLA
ncbi:tetratricopeptide repeat protein [Lysinimonas soli]|uniref:Tetratricopeptide repeat protein n=1 Tax=Lysinimonas soli TaxID=1074233 RepID=A0ABW0NP00_9MICO